MASMVHENRDKLQKTTSCPLCGSTRWEVNVTYKTVISLPTPPQTQFVGNRERAVEEIRCADCKKKAILAVSVGVRETDAYKRAQEREERINKGG